MSQTDTTQMNDVNNFTDFDTDSSGDSDADSTTTTPPVVAGKPAPVLSDYDKILQYKLTHVPPAKNEVITRPVEFKDAPIFTWNPSLFGQHFCTRFVLNVSVFGIENILNFLKECTRLSIFPFCTYMSVDMKTADFQIETHPTHHNTPGAINGIMGWLGQENKEPTIVRYWNGDKLAEMAPRPKFHWNYTVYY
jgi:hypothetical protein